MDYSRSAFTELAVGAALGIISAAGNSSAGSNLISSAGGSLAMSAISVWPLKEQQRFWSRETALTGLNVVGASALSHLLADALIHRNHYREPIITVAPDCGCKIKSWSNRVSENPASDHAVQR